MVLSIFCAISQISDGEFESYLEGEDLLVLQEDLKISFKGQKAAYINVVFEKEVTYRILNQKGIDKLFPVTLPEQMDPTYNPYGPKIRNLNRLMDDIKITEFEVKISKPDGSEVSPDISRKEKEEKIITDRDIYGKMYKYDYYVTEVETGDVVAIHYKYSFPYIHNYFRMFSYRMFLHGKEPRKSYDLTISHHLDLEVDTFFVNNARPEIRVEENQVVYSWEKTNLPGCLDDPGAKAYQELPWFTITLKPYELLYQDYNSFKETFVPMWYYLSFNREDKLRSSVVDREVGAKDRDNLSFNKLARRFTSMGGADTTGIDRLRYFQRYMADSVTYDNDHNYFSGWEGYLKDHPGLQLAGFKVKEHLKEVVYASMIPKMELDFLTAYIADNRFGAMRKEYYAPVYDNEFLFATILNNNTFAYLLPKSDTRNLYCEELPFYYENAPVLLIYSYDFAGYKRNFTEIMRILNTPGSGPADNYRKINSLAVVDPEKGSVSFNTKISLSGQYSTLTRFIYQERACDSTINPRYLHKVWEINQDYEINKVNPGETQIYFPYQSATTASYTAQNLVENSDGKIIIDLNNWIKHIIIENVESNTRFTDFYPDFLGSDTYAYMLQFPFPVEILSENLNVNIDNEFAKFTFDIKQTSPNQVLINSYFLTKKPVISNLKFNDVVTIYKSIEETENSILEVVRISN